MILVDTSVWSFALRRDVAIEAPEVNFLMRCLDRAQSVATTGLVLQELLQGFQGAKAALAIVERFKSLSYFTPDAQEHIAAADIRSTCRRAGVQIGSIDALLIALCVSRNAMLLTTDQDFFHAAKHVPFDLWQNSQTFT